MEMDEKLLNEISMSLVQIRLIMQERLDIQKSLLSEERELLRVATTGWKFTNAMNQIKYKKMIKDIEGGN